MHEFSWEVHISINHWDFRSLHRALRIQRYRMKSTPTSFFTNHFSTFHRVISFLFNPFPSHFPWYAFWCSTVMHNIVHLCYVMLCYIIKWVFYVMLNVVDRHHVVPYYLFYVMLFYSTLWYVTLCCTMVHFLHYITLFHLMQCCDISCCIMFCYTVKCLIFNILFWTV